MATISIMREGEIESPSGGWKPAVLPLDHSRAMRQERFERSFQSWQDWVICQTTLLTRGPGKGVEPSSLPPQGRMLPIPPTPTHLLQRPDRLSHGYFSADGIILLVLPLYKSFGK